MRIKMMCWSTRSGVTGLNNSGGAVEVSHKVSLKLLVSENDTDTANIEFKVENEYELAKWVPGQEYDVEVGVSEVSPAEMVEPEEIQVTPPEGFVIQDKVAVRPGIDLFRWSHWQNKNHWATASVDNVYLHRGYIHGYRGAPSDNVMSVCCRPNEYPVELNDDGIVGMYTDPPQPIESAGGGVQQYDTANQITVTVDDNLNVVKTETSGPTIAERLAFSGINPSDLNVDADE